MKKSQVTVFVIISVVFVVISILIIYKFSGYNSYSDKFQSSHTKNSILFNVAKQCTAHATNLAIQDYGINNASIPFIEEELKKIKDCINQTLLTAFPKYDIFISEPSAKVELTDQNIILDISIPITVKDDKSTIKFNDYIFSFYRKKSEKIEPGKIILSSDNKFKIDLPEDIEPSSEHISIRLVDKNFVGKNNKLVHGNIVYELLPENIKFNSPVTLTMFFDYDIQEDLVIGYYDEIANVWIGLPTKIENNKLTASTDHFSINAALNCMPGTKTSIKTDELFKTSCQDCHTEWNKGPIVVKGIRFELYSTEPKIIEECNGCIECKTEILIKTGVDCNLYNCPGDCNNNVCTTTYYGYTEPLTAEREIKIPLENACINVQGTKPVINTKGFENDIGETGDITITAKGIGEDTWEISNIDQRDNSLSMTIKATNNDGDACLSGYIEVSFIGTTSSKTSSSFSYTSNPSGNYNSLIDSQIDNLKAGGEFIWPLIDPCHRMTCNYKDPSPLCNTPSGEMHTGIDWGREQGTPVYAMADGEVVRASGPEGSTLWDGYGNAIFIKHNINGEIIYSLYGHLSSMQVNKGDKVTIGQKIGLVGNSGFSTGSHLHFEIRQNPGTYGSDISPYTILKYTC